MEKVVNRFYLERLRGVCRTKRGIHPYMLCGDVYHLYPYVVIVIVSGYYLLGGRYMETSDKGQ